MKRLLAITAGLLLSCAMFFVVCAGADMEAKPFKAMWSGTKFFPGPCTDSSFPPGAIRLTNLGKGVSTLWGKSDFIIESCVYPVSATSMTGSGWGIVNAANGDTLHILTEATVDLSADPPEFRETETVVGGTGRFEGATGYSETRGTYTFETDPFPYVPGIHPLLIRPPLGWEGSSVGAITF